MRFRSSFHPLGLGSLTCKQIGIDPHPLDIHRPPVSDRLAALIAPLASDRRRHLLAMARRAPSWDAFVAELEAGGFPSRHLPSGAWLGQPMDRAA